MNVVFYMGMKNIVELIESLLYIIMRANKITIKIS